MTAQALVGGGHSANGRGSTTTAPIQAVGHSGHLGDAAHRARSQALILARRPEDAFCLLSSDFIAISSCKQGPVTGWFRAEAGHGAFDSALDYDAGQA
jgi:hypothetical protein